jgi:ankyrin repeat protein
LEHDADINAQTRDGVTPLYVAVESNHEKMVELFLANRANLNKQNNYGMSPLVLARSLGHQDIADALLLHGAR